MRCWRGGGGGVRGMHASRWLQVLKKRAVPSTLSVFVLMTSQGSGWGELWRRQQLERISRSDKCQITRGSSLRRTLRWHVHESQQKNHSQPKSACYRSPGRTEITLVVSLPPSRLHWVEIWFRISFCLDCLNFLSPFAPFLWHKMSRRLTT